MSNQVYIEAGRRTIEIERDAIECLVDRVDAHFVKACELMLNCTGRVVVSGIGKSGHVANKIAATLASTGTPAFFVHPAEASHGDMGMITRNDVVLALSNSGNTPEITTLLPLLKRLAIPLISMCGNPESTLSRHAEVNLDVSVTTEACPHDLAPTSSTTASLVMGDALAIALLERRGFTAEDFAYSHPGGSLGKRLLLRVSDLMHQGNDLPKVHPDATLGDAILEISAKGLGMTTVLTYEGELEGIFTDGDLRRALDGEINIKTSRVSEIMTTGGKTIHPDQLAAAALTVMEDNKISVLVVVDDNNRAIGAVQMYDLLQAGLA
ncbi:MAG: SIS domain-containing protein [Pseudomonadales bacterium]